MAIINSYPNDKDIQDKDAWIGTDSYNRQTRQYTAEAVSNYLNTQGKISITGQISYQFVTTPNLKIGTMALPNGGGDGTLFSNITDFTMSASDLSGQSVVSYVDYLVGEEIMIKDQAAVSDFGHFKVLSYVQDPSNTDFYNLEVSYVGGNGGVYRDHYYDIVNFTFLTEADKTFVWPQDTAVTVWTIPHNLGKFPSATMALSTGQVGYGDIKYIDNNNLTITFAGDESGKAYLN